MTRPTRLTKQSDDSTPSDSDSDSVAARRAQGLIMSGDRGKALIDEADTRLHAEGVANPPRFVEAFVSGFGD